VEQTAPLFEKLGFTPGKPWVLADVLGETRLCRVLHGPRSPRGAGPLRGPGHAPISLS
jgi:hypothetical protein